MNTQEAKSWLRANRSARIVWTIILIYIGLATLFDLLGIFAISTLTNSANAGMAVSVFIIGLLADIASVWLVWKVSKWALIPLGFISILALSFLSGIKSYLPNIVLLLYVFSIIWPMSQANKKK